MLGKNIHRFITSVAAIAMICTYSAVAIAAPNADGGITVTGQVTVNGQSAVSDSTVVSGSTVVTGANSSAVISLGDRGKVELMHDTALTLKFTDSSIVAMITSGKVRVLSSAGIGATVTSKSATVVADAGQSNSFTVDVGCSDDVKCTQTYVETASGLVTLRSANTVKQVAAGSDAASGNLSQTGCKPCMRPGSAPATAIAGIGGGALAALLAAAGGAVIAAILLNDDQNITTDGNTTVVSPTA